jgi:hypothetical protein
MKRATWVAVVALLLAPPLLAQETDEKEPQEEPQEQPQEKPQEDTLIKGGIDSGGFGALVFRFGEVADQFATLQGVRGGWIINHQFVIGAGLYGVSNGICLDDDRDCRFREIDFGYVGFEFGYIGLWNRVAHYTLQLLIGGGGVSYLNSASEGDLAHQWGDPGTDFFVAEPVANLELNVTKWWRINVGAGYRIVAGLDAGSLESSDLSSVFGNVEFKFGSF